jgi:mandelamide amidase
MIAPGLGTRLAVGLVLAGLAAAPAAAQTRAGGDLIELTAREAAAEIAAGRITSVALTQAMIARAKEKASLNAIITLNEAGALARAAELDAERALGRPRGPLHGVALLVKDNINAAGLPTTAGTPALENFVPAANAPVLQKLLDAGAIVLAKTNMHELAFGITSNNARFGAVANAYEPGRIAGGSSGGTAAALAARMAPAGLGTDTGGSVRIPAALNGIAGLRPSLGRYPNSGIVPIAITRDTAGPMARSVGDLVLLDGVIAGAETEMAPAALTGVRLGLARSMLADLDPETSRLFDAAVARVKAAGAEIVEADVPDLFALNEKVSLAIAAFEFKRDLAAFLAEHKTGVDLAAVAARIASPDVKEIVDTFVIGPKAVPEEAYRQALTQGRPLLQQAYADYFAQNKVEAVIFPTTPLPAAPRGQDETVALNGRQVPTFFTYIRLTDPGSNAGIPGLSLPVGFTRERLPVGLELDGPAGSDRRLLALALAMERVFGRLPPP